MLGKATRSQAERVRSEFDNPDSDLNNWLHKLHRFARARFGIEDIMSPPISALTLRKPAIDVYREMRAYVRGLNGKSLTEDEVNRVIATGGLLGTTEGNLGKRDMDVIDYLGCCTRMGVSLAARHPEIITAQSSTKPSHRR